MLFICLKYNVTLSKSLSQILSHPHHRIVRQGGGGPQIGMAGYRLILKVGGFSFSILPAGMIFVHLAHAFNLNDVCDWLRLKCRAFLGCRVTPPSGKALLHANKGRDVAFVQTVFWCTLDYLHLWDLSYRAKRKGFRKPYAQTRDRDERGLPASKKGFPAMPSEWRGRRTAGRSLVSGFPSPEKRRVGSQPSMS